MHYVDVQVSKALTLHESGNKSRRLQQVEIKIFSNLSLQFIRSVMCFLTQSPRRQRSIPIPVQGVALAK